MRLLLAEGENRLSKTMVMFLKYNYFSVDVVYGGEETMN